jgi:uridine kinase
VVIGIGGVSNSGKSTLAERLAGHFRDKSTKIISQDNFVIPAERIPKIKDHIDWETPRSINFETFNNTVIESIKSFDFVIVEGIFAYYDKQINFLYDKKLFIEISKETFLERKVKDLRWGIEPTWYIDHIWASFIRYGQPKKKMKDIFYIDGNKEVILSDVLQHLISKIM